MDKILSVIVPVYNVEKYLRKCLDSILNQTFSNLEIILVNDGSTDSSPEICEDYAKNDSRIKLIHQKNAGVSVARNIGIISAAGDYITFVDSDDWLEPDIYEKMFSITSEKFSSDIIMCDFFKITNNSSEKISSVLRRGFYSKSEIIEELYPTLIVTEKFGRIPIISVWSCLFKRSLLIDNTINFDGSLMYSEDYLFMAESILKAKSFYYLKENYLYNYLHYEESRSKKYQPDWWENLLYLNLELKNLLQNNGDYDFARQLKLQLLHSTFYVLVNIHRNERITFRQKCKEVKFVIEQPELGAAFENLSFKNQSFSQKIILFFIKHRMAKSFVIYEKLISFIKHV
ncbi:glycosyltransferase [Halpernia frigidisoli]|uniref:Glycosyltransferase involved in cell wall bisynthesis n=1 Tax=Halpernia frigidisoli TaxID=1125876 RepID=A0A1I3FEJ4_9FLAO|nr:glycosyltransferase [Halpernia frigidisoli]SFI09625.1 Glycosyltransferase involved in cell wall bisynthesis [Halpernia frigidisoli]